MVLADRNGRWYRLDLESKGDRRAGSRRSARQRRAEAVGRKTVVHDRVDKEELEMLLGGLWLLLRQCSEPAQRWDAKVEVPTSSGSPQRWSQVPGVR